MAEAGACAIYVEQPNLLGLLDSSLVGVKETGEHTAFIVGVNPVSLGLYEAPGHYGADIVGKGNLGSPMTAGGPTYGIFARSKAYMRPGRIVGRTIDVDEQTAYCLTLSTREQHIRRHRATSNLCTNETLIALMGAMHMSLLGPEGVRPSRCETPPPSTRSPTRCKAWTAWNSFTRTATTSTKSPSVFPAPRPTASAH